MKAACLTTLALAILAGCGSGGGGGGTTVAPAAPPRAERALGPAQTSEPLPPATNIPTTTIQTSFGGDFSPTDPITSFANGSAPGEFNYQTYGTWTRAPSDFAQLMSRSTGQATPTAALPTTGTATFTGTARGVYTFAGNATRQATTADMSATVNFGAREVGFSTSNTVLGPGGGGEGARPELNMTGTLRYSAGVNNFSGAVTAPGAGLSGSANGRFYGPAAQEIGGVYSLGSPDGISGMTGGFGGKRQ